MCGIVGIYLKNKKYNKQLKVVAEALLEYETLTGEEIKLLCQGKEINVSKKLKKTRNKPIGT